GAELPRSVRGDGDFDRHGDEPVVLRPTKTQGDARHAGASMTTPLPDDLPPELLAAYADGELCPRERARVEEWLAEHPEGAELLEAQESVGPGNVELWQS